MLTNIQRLQGEGNRGLQNQPDDLFDLILFDEGHHNVAESWDALKAKVALARIVNFGATPLRTACQLMAGRIHYSYPAFRAIQEGCVKRLKAIVVNPRTLRYVRRGTDTRSRSALTKRVAVASRTPISGAAS